MRGVGFNNSICIIISHFYFGIYAFSISVHTFFVQLLVHLFYTFLLLFRVYTPLYKMISAGNNSVDNRAFHAITSQLCFPIKRVYTREKYTADLQYQHALIRPHKLGCQFLVAARVRENYPRTGSLLAVGYHVDCHLSFCTGKLSYVFFLYWKTFVCLSMNFHRNNEH